MDVFTSATPGSRGIAATGRPGRTAQSGGGRVASAGLARILNKSVRLLTRPTPERVLRINYAVTYLCDSRCVMCDIWKRYREDPSGIAQELTADEIERAVSASTALTGVDAIALTGGEPFIKRDFVAIYAFFRHRYSTATIVVNTNGFNSPLIEKRTAEMLESGGLPPILMFSVDGLAEVHERIRGVRDGLAKIKRSIASVRRLNPVIQIGLSFTIMPENIRDLEGVYALSVELGASFTMRFGTRSDTYYRNTEWDGAWARAELDAVEPAIGRVTADILRRHSLVARALNPDTYFYSRMTDYQRAPRRIFECFSGTHSFFMDPWGNVYPCIILPTSLGNIRQQPFDELWFSTLAGAVRTDIAEERCHCWTECEALPSLQRTLRRRHESSAAAAAAPSTD